MASHIPLVEDGHVIGIDGKPLAPAPVNAWEGLPFEIHPHMRKGEVAHRYNPHPLLLVRLRAHGRSRIRSGTTVFDLALAPGQVDVYPLGFRMDHAWWDCTPGEVLAVEIDPERARGYLHDELGRLQLDTSLAGRDPVLEQLAVCMRTEVENGCRSGRLYAEGLSLALLARLATRHGGPAPEAQRTRLSSWQLRRVAAFIDANICADLSVQALAQQLSMSPYTFTRLFKAATQASPHQYVVTQRIRQAEALFDSELSLSQIALAVGFASQSHFTEAYRRRTGRTPAGARRSSRPLT
jgi:AraC family transcriptional regulator